MTGDGKGVHEIWKIRKLNEVDVGYVGGPDILKAWREELEIEWRTEK